jgi:hypothetical protein
MVILYVSLAPVPLVRGCKNFHHFPIYNLHQGVAEEKRIQPLLSQSLQPAVLLSPLGHLPLRHAGLYPYVCVSLQNLLAPEDFPLGIEVLTCDYEGRGEVS